MQTRDKLIAGSRFVVRTGVILNRLFLLAVSIGLILSFPYARQLTEMLIQENTGMDWRLEVIGIRMLMVIGVLMALATERLFSALGKIIATAEAGDPFVAENANRLRTIGWALLGLQLLGIPSDAVGHFYPFLSSGSSDTFSPGGWLAVLMVFVLSRVFRVGSAMREDLEGTV